MSFGSQLILTMFRLTKKMGKIHRILHENKCHPQAENEYSRRQFQCRLHGAKHEVEPVCFLLVQSHSFRTLWYQQNASFAIESSTCSQSTHSHSVDSRHQPFRQFSRSRQVSLLVVSRQKTQMLFVNQQTLFVLSILTKLTPPAIDRAITPITTKSQRTSAIVAFDNCWRLHCVTFMIYMVSGHLATRESRHQPSRHQRTTSPPTNPPPSHQVVEVKQPR